MARKLKDRETPPPSEGDGANGLTPEKFISLVQRQVALNAERDALRARINKFRKEARADGVVLKKFDAMILMSTWEPAEVREAFATDRQYATWLELPGYRAMEQMDLFADDPEKTSEEDWESRGFIAATTGRGTVCEAPANCPGDRIQAWQTGWHRGIEKNAVKLGA